jgi:hypothetical protein
MKRLLALCGILVCLSATAQAQGLIWTLPEDGAWVRYEGTYSQSITRANSTEGNLALQWRRFLTIKSVGREEREYQGKVQPCRWIEFTSETGKTTEGVLDAGPGGTVMYRLLVPESAIRGTVNEPVGKGREIIAEFIPIVQGYRRIGDEPPQEVEPGGFQLYPSVSLLRHYRQLTDAGRTTVSVPAGNFEATQYNGHMVSETTSHRMTNTCELFRSSEIPFGVVKWTAKSVDESKGTAEPRSAFLENATLVEEMQAVRIGTGAESDFPLN